jgi:hypothetical protein
MRRVVSVSLGSPSRDWQADLSPLGVPLLLERRGVGLDYAAYAAALRELDEDPLVAAIGLGGINRYLFCGDRRYELRRAAELAATVHSTPLCDGSGLKQYWEPYVVSTAAEAGALPLRNRNALMVCAVDRWGMAAALEAGGARLVLGDVMFALGLPVPFRSLASLQSLGRALLPVITRRVPFEWLYPTGESTDTPRYGRWYAWADVLAGDWKYLGKYRPDTPGALAGKVVVTNTTTRGDVEALRELGVATLITTTPVLGGRSFGTNLVEAAAAALAGAPPDSLRLADYQRLFEPMGWHRPRVQHLQAETPTDPAG